jgi:hypothetical protein
MGFSIELQDEWGGWIARVEDPKGLIDNLLPSIDLDDDSYPILSSIDPYADTTFNGLQMRRFLLEWSNGKATTDEQLALVSAVEILARRCSLETHTYLEFIGD